MATTSSKCYITNALRRIRNAWHFCYALILVIKVVCGNIVLRCSPLKRALCKLVKFGDIDCSRLAKKSRS
ncbi:DUF3265 domain-containing protein [Vibrio parahaemolyticus]|nr:DUF3265 domain-containing protein [Vibrio parahaemolyticus]